MHPPKGHLKRMSRRLMRYRLVLLGGIWEGIIVRDGLNPFKFRIERVQRWFGAESGFDVCLLGYELLGVYGRCNT